VAVDGRGVELDVVDADDLPPVDVDDLLIQQIALEEDGTPSEGEYFSQAEPSSAVRTVAPHDLSTADGSTRSPSDVLTIR
jgi:hypothetical protein